MLCFWIDYKLLVGLGLTTIRVEDSVGKVPRDIGNSDFFSRGLYTAFRVGICG